MRYQANYLGLESDFDLEFMDQWVRIRWNIKQLGEPFPGGYWLVLAPTLTFERADGEPIQLTLIGSATRPEPTVAGFAAYRRVRGLAMTDYPWSYAVSLPAGDYKVKFDAELFDCRRLVYYCDAMQFFAGYFLEMVEKFEENARYWASKNHAEAGEPFRFPCELTLGSLSVPRDYTNPPYYHLSNEAELPQVPWEPPPPLRKKPSPAAPLQPEIYFNDQLQSGIGQMRDYNFCRWGTHCTEQPVPQGSCGTGMRPFAMWANSFTLHYQLTNDPESGAAAYYSSRMIHGFTEQGPQPHQQHVLTFGVGTMSLLRLVRATGDAGLLSLVADIWRRWPYDEERHNLATEPSIEGGDTTPNDTYNMKMVGATAMWLLGKYLDDKALMSRARDSVLNFVLPGLQPEGYWYYRPGSPEGEIVNGIMSNNHYDGFVKYLVSRLLMHEEWRNEPGVLDALRRGMDFTLNKLTEDDGRVLTYELHPGAKYGPRETLARNLGHGCMFAEPLAVLAQYVDKSYLQPLQRSLQYVYDQRDNPVLEGYWDNAWFYSVYTGLFSLSALGYSFEGTPQQLSLRQPAATEPIL